MSVANESSSLILQVVQANDDQDDDGSLFDAAEKGDITRMKQMLENGSNPRATNSRQQTTLHVVTYTKHNVQLEMAKLLLSKQGDGESLLNMQDYKGHTPIHHAAKYKALPLLEYYLSVRNPTPIFNLCNLEGNSFIILLLDGKLNKHFKTVGKILENIGQEWKSACNDNLLHATARLNNDIMLKHLIDYAQEKKKTWINDLNDSNHTPLLVSASAGSLKCATLLFPKTQPQNGCPSQLKVAIVYRQEAMVKYLLERPRTKLWKKEEGKYPFYYTLEPDAVHIAELFFSVKDLSSMNILWNSPDMMDALYRYVPESVIPALTKSFNFEVVNRGKPEITLEYSCITGKGEAHCCTDSFYINLVVKHSENVQERVLRHPLVQNYVEEKWKKYYIYSIASLIFQVIGVVVFTLFVRQVYVTPKVLGVPKENTTLFEPSVKHSGNTVLVSLLFLYILFLVIYEFAQAWSDHRNYFMTWVKGLVRWLKISTIFLILVRHIVYGTTWDLPLPATAIFLAWAMLMKNVGKLSRWGRYDQILIKVLKDSIYFLLTMMPIILAFSFGFEILLNRPEFSFPYGIPKVLIMMASELNFSEVSESNNGFPSPFQWMAYGFFVFSSVIVIINLLTALAVQDVQELVKYGHLCNIRTKLQDVYLFEVWESHFYRLLKSFKLQIHLPVQINERTAKSMGQRKTLNPLTHTREFRQRILNLIRDRKDVCSECGK